MLQDLTPTAGDPDGRTPTAVRLAFGQAKDKT